VSGFRGRVSDGFFGSLISVDLSPSSGWIIRLIPVVCLPFLAGLTSARISLSHGIWLWVEMFVGVGVGLGVDVMFVDPVLNGGESNFWPLEMGSFMAMGFLPSIAGLVLGRAIFKAETGLSRAAGRSRDVVGSAAGSGLLILA
jgi:hypothetical protein